MNATALSTSPHPGLTFVICIKPDSAIALPVLRSQIASCLAVEGANVFVGLSCADARIETAATGDPRVRAEVLSDCSLYDGWNRAIERIDDDRIVFLGYGDCVINPRHFEGNRLCGLDVLFARALIVSPDRDRTFGRRFLWRLHYYRQTAAMIGAMFRRDILARERFDPTLRIAGDYEFLLRVGPTLRAGFVPLTVVSMPDGGLSEAAFPQMMEEVRRIRQARKKLTART